MTVLEICVVNEKDCMHYFLVDVLVHCFAHQLQLVVVAAFRVVIVVYKFFSNLNFIINVVSASCERHHDLQDAQEADIAHLMAMDKLETRKGANQIDTLK
jgi:hypothetical protein